MEPESKDASIEAESLKDKLKKETVELHNAVLAVRTIEAETKYQKLERDINDLESKKATLEQQNRALSDSMLPITQTVIAEALRATTRGSYDRIEDLLKVLQAPVLAEIEKQRTLGIKEHERQMAADREQYATQRVKIQEENETKRTQIKADTVTTVSRHRAIENVTGHCVQAGTAVTIQALRTTEAIGSTGIRAGAMLAAQAINTAGVVAVKTLEVGEELGRSGIVTIDSVSKSVIDSTRYLGDSAFTNASLLAAVGIQSFKNRTGEIGREATSKPPLSLSANTPQNN